MLYKSTRSVKGKTYKASQVILRGLAPDGGLFMPTEIPKILPSEWKELAAMSYPELAANILHRYLSDYTEAELLEDAKAAYGAEKFPDGATDLRMVTPRIFSLELWHGPTCAFKDMALQMMPRLMSRALKKNKEKKTAMILVATSGDTGKAALEGYRDVDGIKIKVFYPAEGVSDTQKLQMTTQEGDNVSVSGIVGNFDDAQNGVKAIFSSRDMTKALKRRDVFLSSANSINWGRLAPQIVYYVHGYLSLLRNGAIYAGQTVDVCVPTGNFGNILAAYFAKEMGIPFGKLICASNQNDVLTDFFHTGVYDRNRPFHTTVSPSMDILISSNLERLLYLVCGAEKTAAYMQQLKETGKYQLSDEEFSRIRQSIVAYSADDAQTLATIREVFESTHYLADTHTAVALSASLAHIEDPASAMRILTVSTASPFKFSADVLEGLTGQAVEQKETAAEKLAAAACTTVPTPLCGLADKPIRFPEVIEADRMAEDVLAFADR